jgi:hypothetical protein
MKSSRVKAILNLIELLIIEPFVGYYHECAYAAQRFALAAVGAGLDSLVKRDKLQATKNAKKRAAHPPSAARHVGRRPKIVFALS